MYASAKTPVRTDDDDTPRRRGRWLVALFLLLLIGGVVWAMRPKSHLDRAQELQKVLFSPDAKNMPPEERKALFEEYRSEMKQLTDDQKAQLFEPMHKQHMADLDRYFAMSQQEKNRYLDERIDRSEKSKKDWQQKCGGASPPGFGGGAGGKGGGGSAEDIEKRKKQSLDRTSPEDRAKMDQYRRDMDNRRRQRGLPVTPR